MIRRRCHAPYFTTRRPISHAILRWMPYGGDRAHVATGTRNRHTITKQTGSRSRRETKVMAYPQPFLDFEPILFDGMITFLTRTREATYPLPKVERCGLPNCTVALRIRKKGEETMKIRKLVATSFIILTTAALTVPSASAETMSPGQPPSTSLPATSPDVDGIIAKAKSSDVGFSARRNLIASSAAFMQILRKTTPDHQRSLDYFTAISSDQQATELVANTAGKHYVVSGTMQNPDVKLVDGKATDDSTNPPGAKNLPQDMPRCGKAWAAFPAWLTGTTMLCAPFSGPAAWGCAAAMGTLGLMPDFNSACD